MDRPTKVEEKKYSSNNTSPCTGDWNKPSTNQVVSPKDDPKAFFQTAVDRHGFFSLTEPGLTHPTTTSCVKLRDNGMIDIFVTTNQGIRIDPNTRSITIITNRVDIRCNEHREWVESNSITRVRKNWELYSDSTIKMLAKKNIEQEVQDGHLIQTIKTGNLKHLVEIGDIIEEILKGSLLQNVNKEWKITVVGDATIKAKNVNVIADNTINLTSTGEMKLKASKMTFTADRYDYT